MFEESVFMADVRARRAPARVVDKKRCPFFLLPCYLSYDPATGKLEAGD